MTIENNDATNTTDTNLNDLEKTLNDTLFESFDDGLYIGMMSGTSLDGMDAVLCQFSSNVKTDNSNDENASAPMQLLTTYSQDFPKRLREVLLALCQPNGIKGLISQDDEPDDKCGELDWFGWASRLYGEFASEVVNTLLQQADIDTESVLAIGCHGQTVRHRPQMGFSLQLVDANIIAEHTGISVISDFRRRDMAVGGQGAPLVPAFHQALFSATDKTRVLLNLGGIANITVLPTNSLAHSTDGHSSSQNEQQTTAQITGYDTGPANLLLDAWAALHTGKDYDAGGAWAQTGQIIEPLLTQLLTHPFFAKSYPKSTGREDFNLAWLQAELQTFDQTATNTRYSSADVQATLTELTAISASVQIKQFIKDNDGTANNLISAVYICGGGALNDYLMTRLQAHLPYCTIGTTASLGLDPTWVEAVAFAWLARQTLMGETGNLPAVTGASKNVVLGQVCFA
ncbi:anhydro-N-acetylmuramic acid kinase [Psychrobacter sp. LV10R520-6]|uniref:anhydro-N-acetylmuramic acid kinase n=1 Tax=Psychrobacter sp. LV10R520-6 TaxID=1415574 RepID=UPI0024CA5FFE|nr:anhydro-N-acetylmuramic acid kinase [Psychrobacter sp. LV10R520-6]SNT70841.1 anhydro-N-acetylmuramic acid kinase [Psychrobacter sp. LV10R520-6]